MKQEQVVSLASNAALRASNALDDLHGYLTRRGDASGLLAVSSKVSSARHLIHEIEAELANSILDPGTPNLARHAARATCDSSSRGRNASDADTP